MFEAKVFRTFIRIYSVFKSERLSTNIKLTLHKALIGSVVTYVCTAWELAADTYHLKLQRLQNKILCTTGNFQTCTPVSDLHTAFNLRYIYSYITKLCRQQTDVMQNYENEHVHSVGQVDVRHKKCKRLKFGGGQAYHRSGD
jgi:hypothetical protein